MHEVEYLLARIGSSDVDARDVGKVLGCGTVVSATGTTEAIQENLSNTIKKTKVHTAGRWIRGSGGR